MSSRIFVIKSKLSKIIGSSLFRTSGVYTICNFINAAIPLILLPILTRKLTPADYGIVSMFQLAIGVIYPFISINLEGALSRRFYDQDKVDFASYIGSCLMVGFAASSVLTIFLFGGLSGYFHDLTQIPSVWLPYILVVGLCQFIISVILVIYQVKVQPIKYGVLQISQTILNLGLTIYLLFVLDKKWEGRLQAQVVTSIAIASLCLIALARENLLKFKVKKEYFQHSLRFGIPLIPHALGGMLFTTIDRFFLTNLVGLEQTGNYTVAYQLGAVISLVTVAFNNAYVPWLYGNLQKESHSMKIKIVKFTYLYFSIIVVGALGLILLFPTFVSFFVSSSFDTINTYSLFIVFGFVFHGMYFMVTNYIFYAERTHIQGVLTISIAVVKVPITYFCIIYFGPVGAALSFCLTYFLLFVITWIYSNKVYPMPWDLRPQGS